MFHDSRCAWFEDGKQWTLEWAILLADWTALEKQYGPPPLMETPIPEAVAQIALRYAYFHNRTTPWDYAWRMTPDDWQRLVDATAAFRDLPGVRSHRLADAMRDYAGPYIHPQNVSAISNRPADAPAPPARHLIAPQPIQTETAQAPTAGPGTNWPDAKLLADADAQDVYRAAPGNRGVEFPLVDRAANTAYGLSFATPADRREPSRLNLIRFDLATGSSQRVCSYAATSSADRPVGWRIERLSLDCAELTPGCYLYCNADQGVFLFPTSGEPVLTVDRFTAKLPDGSFQAATLLDNTVYLAVGQPSRDGYLLSLNLKDQTLRTLASSRRLSTTAPASAGGAVAPATQAAGSPFDDAPPLIAWRMRADPPRHRIVLLVSNPSWPNGMSGWWEFKPASGQFKLLAPLDMTRETDRSSSGDWQSPCGTDRIAFATITNRAAVLDLATDRVSPMPSVPRAPDDASPKNASADRPALGFPLVPADEWIWGKFGRYRVVHATGRKDSIELQSFKPLTSENSQWGRWPGVLEPIDDDHVIIGDKGSLWLLHVPSQDPAAMSRLLQPPRPMYVSVEPAGKPPVDAHLPWTSVTTICDAARGINLGEDSPRFLLAPQIVGDDAYVFAAGSAGHPDGGVLLKFSLLDGKRTGLGTAYAPQLDLRSGTLAERTTVHLGGCSSCIDDHNYYLVVPNNLILAFPLGGGAPRQFPFGGFVSQIAAISDTLFVIERIPHPRTQEQDFPGWTERLVRINLATGVREALPLLNASSDSGVLPAVNLMRADARRGRVLFFIDHSGKVNPGTSGLWSCAPAGAPCRLDPFDIWSATGECFGAAGDWAGEIDGDAWLLLSSNGAVRVHLNPLHIERLWQVEPKGESALGASYDFRAPIAVVDGWLWDQTFRRAKLDGTAFEQLPYLRTMHSPQYALGAQTMRVLHGGDQLFVADNCGMWVVKLRNR